MRPSGSKVSGGAGTVRVETEIPRSTCNGLETNGELGRLQNGMNTIPTPQSQLYEPQPSTSKLPSPNIHEPRTLYPQTDNLFGPVAHGEGVEVGDYGLHRALGVGDEEPQGIPFGAAP